MKHNTLLAATAMIALIGAQALTSASAQPERGDRQQPGQYEGARQAPSGQNTDNDYRDRREAWRDQSANARWDVSRYNGYYENDRWTYGEPSADRYQRPGFSLGYRPWSVGDRLGYFSTRFQPVDYRRENLRPPTRGLRWVQDDRGDYLLVARNGRIAQVVVSGNMPRDRRQNWRDAGDARWDDARHNGYYRNGVWAFGRPQEGMRDVSLGYRPWQRGERLGYYNGKYAEVDYRSNNALRAPPRGYHWVRNDSGDYLLAAIAGGLIAQVILNSSR